MTNMSKHNTTDISPYCFNQNLILVGIEKLIYTAISNFISCLSCGLRARVKDFQWLHLHLQFIFVLPRVGICVICARKTFTCGKQEAMVLMQLIRTPNLFFFPQKPGFVMPWYICFPTILDLCNLFMKSRALTGKHLFASKPGNYTPWCLTEMSSPGGYTSFRRKHKERQKKTASSSSQSSRDGQIQGNGQIDQIGIFGRDWQSLWPKLWVAADLNKWIVRFSALLFITNGRACIFKSSFVLTELEEIWHDEEGWNDKRFDRVPFGICLGKYYLTNSLIVTISLCLLYIELSI